MPGGKQRLKHLFTTGIQVGADGTAAAQILTGSVSFATPGCAVSTTTGACVVTEVTIANLAAQDYIVGSVSAMSGCFQFQGEIMAGDGQASLVYRFGGGCPASVDARAVGGTLRYIAIKPL